MRVLELFSGTGSFSKVAKRQGHDVFTVDIETKFNPSLCIDVLELDAKTIIDKFGRPNVIWASPPCTTFSVASLVHYWHKGKPKNDACRKGIAIARKTLSLIDDLKPEHYFIENPRGMLRKMPFMARYKRHTVSYCQYGMRIMKPTDIWTNICGWTPKICSPLSPCHERASKGSKNLLKGIYNDKYNSQFGRTATKRAVIPQRLCEELFAACNNSERQILLEFKQ
jgi:hypothetical protein